MTPEGKKIDISSYIIKFPLEYSIMKGNLGGENHVDLIKITFMRHGKLQKQRSNRKCLYFYEQKCQIIEEDQRKFGLMLMNWEKLARSCLFRFFLQCLCLQEKGKNLCIWGDWKDSSVVKSRYCSCRGPELISEHLSQAVYHCL